MNKKNIVYPYIPNSVAEVKGEMLEAIGCDDLKDLFSEIPAHLKLDKDLDLPEPILDEYSIRRHVEGMLNKNKNCSEYLSFLGAGCAQHFVPAVCDEINGRGEFLTAYAAEFYADHGKWQALFEFCSLMGELLDMDVVSGFLYDGAQAIATSLRMAARITGRKEVLIPSTLDPQIFMVLENYMKGVYEPQVDIQIVDYDRRTGQMDIDDLQKKISDKTAAVLIENPSYLGFIEDNPDLIGEIARENGAEFVVFVDPISLGVMTPPSQYGATITCGDFHPLGIHMQGGGGQGGVIATHDDMKYVMEFKDKMYGLTHTTREGEYGFANILFNRTSFGSREMAKEFTGTSNALWAITAGVYLSLLGPQGMEEVGQTIMQKAQYAADRLSRINGIKLQLKGPFFKEFVLNFDATGKTVEEINKGLLVQKIFGGKDISVEFPEFGQAALYCVTEIMTMEDIERLVEALKELTA